MTNFVMAIKKKQTAPDRARTIPQRVGRGAWSNTPEQSGSNSTGSSDVKTTEGRGRAWSKTPEQSGGNSTGSSDVKTTEGRKGAWSTSYEHNK